jgi:hypothetical protein
MLATLYVNKVLPSPFMNKRRSKVLWSTFVHTFGSRVTFCVPSKVLLVHESHFESHFVSLAKYYHSYEFSIIGRVLTPPWVGGGYAHRAHREHLEWACVYVWRKRCYGLWDWRTWVVWIFWVNSQLRTHNWLLLVTQWISTCFQCIVTGFQGLKDDSNRCNHGAASLTVNIIETLMVTLNPADPPSPYYWFGWSPI